MSFITAKCHSLDCDCPDCDGFAPAPRTAPPRSAPPSPSPSSDVELRFACRAPVMIRGAYVGDALGLMRITKELFAMGLLPAHAVCPDVVYSGVYRARVTDAQEAAVRELIGANGYVVIAALPIGGVT